MSSLRGSCDAREALAQRLDDVARVVHRERGLRQHGESRGIRREREPRHVGAVLDEAHALGRVAHRALDLDVTGVADEHDLVAALGEAPRLDVHLGHQRAGGVDGAQPLRARRPRARRARRRAR